MRQSRFSIMSPKEKKRKLSAFSDPEITRLLASLVDFQSKSPDVEIEDDKTIIHLVDTLTDALSRLKVFAHGFWPENVLTDVGSTTHSRRLL